MLTLLKMSRTLLMFSTMTTLTIRRTTCTVLGVLDVLAARALQSPCLQLTVCNFLRPLYSRDHTYKSLADAKQARDLVAVLTESKQQIDPRLAEMARYGGGGSGGRFGGRGGRGGRGGGGGGYTGSNSAPVGGGRRW